MSKTENRDYIVVFELYLLRYVVKNDWYELQDVVRDYLVSKKHKVSYKKDDLIYNGLSMKQVCDEANSNKEKENDS